MKNYCSGCKKMLPIAVGLPEGSWVLVSHVIQEPMCHGVPCRPQRFYAQHEREYNWSDDEAWDL
jgi:hypothetical protein